MVKTFCVLHLLLLASCGDLQTDTVSSWNCWTNSCQNGGTCTHNGQQSNCMCPVGFTGRDCSEMQSDTTVSSWNCWPSPCQNGGTCTDNAQSDPPASAFYCMCPVGFTGRDCSESMYVQ
ncbi:hypothetical protein V1264_024543 [Littorina saxatilis]|uniref:EGF-like domain-containing protein n=1 Tax=Littorina saxatilis TaxID=31220 RepID=A0AAN9AMB1_9CAEN